jgi:hypothetical protein
MASSIPDAPEAQETKTADYIVYIRGVFIPELQGTAS